MVLASRAPVILDRLRVSNFARTESGRAVGLTAGIGLPVTVDNQVRLVLTMLTGRNSTQFVCEVWRPDRSRSVLQLRDGFYGKYRGFQGISALTRPRPTLKNCLEASVAFATFTEFADFNRQLVPGNLSSEFETDLGVWLGAVA